MARRQGKQDASTRARPRGGKTPTPEAAVYLTLSGGVIDTEPVGEDESSVEGLQAGIDIVIGHHAFPQEQLNTVLGRVPRPPVLLAKRKRGRAFCYPDIDHVLRELVKVDGKIPADGLVRGTTWLLPGPKPGEDAARWLNRVVKRSKLKLMPGKDAREHRAGRKTQDPATSGAASLSEASIVGPSREQLFEPYPELTAEELRSLMKRAAEEAACPLAELGKAMAAGEDQKAAINAAWYLLNRSENISFKDVLHFCNAVRKPISEVFFPGRKSQV